MAQDVSDALSFACGRVCARADAADGTDGNDKRMNGGRRGRATPTPPCHLAPMIEARHTPRAHWTTLAAMISQL